MHHSARIVIALIAAAFSANASATTYCAETAQQLQAALSLAAEQNSSLEQTVRLSTGTFDLGDAAIAIQRSPELVNLTIEGGFEPGCLQPKLAQGAQYTTMASGALSISSSGDVRFRDITFEVTAVNAGLAFFQGGNLEVERVVFKGTTGQGADAVVASATENVSFTNVLVDVIAGQANCAVMAATLGAGGVAFQHVTVAVTHGNGLCLDGFNSAASIALTNSIIEAPDGQFSVAVNADAPPIQLSHNVYGSLAPWSGVIGVDDIIMGSEVFAQTPVGTRAPGMSLENPAVDTGDPSAGTTVETDVYGATRFYGRPDRGAIESDRIFGARF